MQSNENKSGKGGMNPKVIAVIVAVVLILSVVIVLLLPKNEVPTLPTTLPTTSTNNSTEPTPEGPTEPVMLPQMAELYAQNPDIIGWVRVEGTLLDYPVMFTPDDEEKYIRADFKGNLSMAGLPFMDKDCSMDPESQNLVIYGHNMKNGTAFKTLFDYTDKKFWEEHPTIYFSTLYEERTYEVLAVFYDRVYKKSDTCFKFYNFINPPTEETFNEGITYFKDNALYDTGVTAEQGDRLISLVTCSYHTDNGRLVLVAREVTEGQNTEG